MGLVGVMYFWVCGGLFDCVLIDVDMVVGDFVCWVK